MEERIINAILKSVGPRIDKIMEKAGNHHTHIIENRRRIEKLEQNNADLAAIINDYQSLQAQVKTLQFEVARLEHQLEGKAEPNPWK